VQTCDCGADAEEIAAGVHNEPCTSRETAPDDPSDAYGQEFAMTTSKMPRPKPPVLTPDQMARAIDQRNKEARKGLRGVARLNAKTVADAEAQMARRLGIGGLAQPKPKPGGRA
jgi:hypothetical protein